MNYWLHTNQPICLHFYFFVKMVLLEFFISDFLGFKVSYNFNTLSFFSSSIPFQYGNFKVCIINLNLLLCLELTVDYVPVMSSLKHSNYFKIFFNLKNLNNAYFINYFLRSAEQPSTIKYVSIRLYLLISSFLFLLNQRF
jgi:hypothetical protein